MEFLDNVKYATKWEYNHIRITLEISCIYLNCHEHNSTLLEVAAHETGHQIIPEYSKLWKIKLGMGTCSWASTSLPPSLLRLWSPDRKEWKQDLCLHLLFSSLTGMINNASHLASVVPGRPRGGEKKGIFPPFSSASDWELEKATLIFCPNSRWWFGHMKRRPAAWVQQRDETLSSRSPPVVIYDVRSVSVITSPPMLSSPRPWRETAR